MIGRLHGIVEEKTIDAILIDVQGVGYEVACATPTLEHLAIGDSLKLYIHTHVREDVLQLFGFLSVAEKQLFLSLIKVNGVGPKMAMQILSGADFEKIVDMIEREDAKGLTTLPKVGKKTAEQLILSLKGKLVLVDQPTKRANRVSGLREQTISALVNLGYRSQDVELIVDELEPITNIQEAIRRALQTLSGNLTI